MVCVLVSRLQGQPGATQLLAYLRKRQSAIGSLQGWLLLRL